ncbi:hypothetical protein Trydic_g17190 [Trypoxylus dichotomus]
MFQRISYLDAWQYAYDSRLHLIPVLTRIPALSVAEKLGDARHVVKVFKLLLFPHTTLTTIESCSFTKAKIAIVGMVHSFLPQHRQNERTQPYGFECYYIMPGKWLNS